MQPDVTCDFTSVSTSVKLQVAARALSLLTNLSNDSEGSCRHLQITSLILFVLFWSEVVCESSTASHEDILTGVFLGCWDSCFFFFRKRFKYVIQVLTSKIKHQCQQLIWIGNVKSFHHILVSC